MALILLNSTCCPLCGNVIRENDDIVATTHFLADPSDHLWPFSDAAMHRGCFLSWEHREEFVAKYNATMGAIAWSEGQFHDMQPDGTILIRQCESKFELDEPAT